MKLRLGAMLLPSAGATPAEFEQGFAGQNPNYYQQGLRDCARLLEQVFSEETEDRDAILVEVRDRLLQMEPRWFVEQQHYLAGCTLLELGAPRRALVHFEKTRFPSESEVALRKGLCELFLGKTAEASARFQEIKV